VVVIAAAKPLLESQALPLCAPAAALKARWLAVLRCADNYAGLLRACLDNTMLRAMQSSGCGRVAM